MLESNKAISDNWIVFYSTSVTLVCLNLNFCWFFIGFWWLSFQLPFDHWEQPIVKEFFHFLPLGFYLWHFQWLIHIFSNDLLENSNEVESNQQNLLEFCQQYYLLWISSAKGQLISKCLFSVFNSPQNKFEFEFLP